MMQTKTQFQLDLFDEHIEECSFLMEQIAFIRDEPEDFYEDAIEEEWRFHRHFNALMGGGDLADQRCLEILAGADWGALATAVMVLEQRAQTTLLLDGLANLDGNDSDVAHGLFMAWLLTPPAEGFQNRWNHLADVNPGLLAPLSRAGAWLREPAMTSEIHATAPSPDESALLTRARGRLRGRADDPATLAPAFALEVALMQGHPRAIDLAREAFEQEPSPWLAFAGNASDASRFAELIADPTQSELGFLGTAMLGLPHQIPLLLDLLETHGHAAHRALQFMTGLTVGSSDDDQDPGELTVAWRDAIAPHMDAWLSLPRLRRGRPWSATHLLDDLTTGTQPNWTRRWLTTEIRIRFGIDIPLEWEFWSQQWQSTLNRFAATQPQINDRQIPFPYAGRPS